MTQPDDQQPPPADQSSAGQVALAVGTVALLQGVPDPWLPSRWLRAAGIRRAEQRMFATWSDLLSRWIDRFRTRILHGTHVDPYGVFADQAAYRHAVTDVVEVQIRQIYEAAHDFVAIHTPVPPTKIETYLQGALNRLVGVPDHVFQLVNAEVMKAASEGWSIDQLAEQVHSVLSDEGTALWRNRATVIARTEAIAAYNAGTFAGFQSYAAQTGGTWEKGWLATHDTRTRPTHLAADIGTAGTGQRVKLDEPFRVGDALLDFPGAPGPVAEPEEVIQCRCSLVLLRPGGGLDLSHRHGKGGPA